MRLRPHEIVENANRIAAEYAAQGLTLTLRQMYYRFVATGLCPNGQKAYKSIGAALTEARYTGKFPIDALEDRGRSISAGSHLEWDLDVDGALAQAAQNLRNAPYYLRTGAWYAQPRHVSVWVEKEALAGIFAPVCSELGVSFMACKGYPSVSVLYDFVASLIEVEQASEGGPLQEHVVLYFGDHDPDGLEIPLAAARSVRRLCVMLDGEGSDEDDDGYGYEDDEDDGEDEDDDGEDDVEDGGALGADVVLHVPNLTAPVRFHRAALNIAQIRAFNPPPFPAKETSARFAKYAAKTGLRDAWELDALEPRALINLIRTEVGGLFDSGVARDNRRAVEAARAEMRTRMQEPGRLASLLESE